MKKPRRSTVYLIVLGVFLFALNILLGFFLIKQSDDALRTQIGERMLDVSNTAAAMLDGDALAILEAEDADTPAYQNVLKTLTYYQDNIELEYIYCIRDLGGGNFIFMIDPSEDPGEFGEPIAYTDALYQASLGTPCIDKKPYSDRWGRFYSAYTPVFDSKGRVAGIVAVDFSADWYERQISTQVETTLIISGISLIFAGAVITTLIVRYRKRFRTVFSEINTISEEIETFVREVVPGAKINPRGQETRKRSGDEITEFGNQIRSLERQLSERIEFVRAQAYVDSLTGLGNRMAYEEYIARLDDKIKWQTAAFAVVIFDLNELKRINDELGHERGDQAIIALGHALEQSFPKAKLYRIGGDEFVVILEKDYMDIGSRMLRVDKILTARGESQSAKGCAIYSPKTDESYRDVFKRADNAMYDDKKAYYMTHKDRRRK